MRIVRASVSTVAAPFPRPLRFAPKPMTTNTAVIVQLEDASGAVGLGYAPTFGFGTRALHSLVTDDFAPLLTGAELESVEWAVETLLRDAWLAGRPAGFVPQAVSMLELALYDIEGQLAELPLHRLWGQPTGEVRAYASGGWRYLGIEELAAQARAWTGRGFDAMKLQVGLSPAEDAERLRMIRDVVGPDVELMLDANQRMPAADAVAWAAALAPFRPSWLEEPIRAERHDLLAEIRSATSIPIAAGESETERVELEDLLRRGAVDVIQPDIHRVGVTTARAIADELADDAAPSLAPVMVAPHLAHEVGAQLLSGTVRSGWVEYFDWFDDWWEAPVLPRDGRVTPSELPGHGLRIRQGWLEAHAIS